MLRIDNSKCNDCEECILVCPNNAINFVDDRLVVDKMKCKQCNICISVCPVSAIKKIEGVKNK